MFKLLNNETSYDISQLDMPPDNVQPHVKTNFLRSQIVPQSFELAFALMASLEWFDLITATMVEKEEEKMKLRAANLGALTAFLVSSTALATWVEVRPGGETACARGGEFSFFHHLGDSDRVVVDFLGGGACWDTATCRENSFAFKDNVDEVRKRILDDSLEGIHDGSRLDNGFADWTRIIIPYCTGDLHWGDAIVADAGDERGPMHHKGAVNVKSVLTWLAATGLDPEQVLVTGCSAGSYASIYWTPHLQEMFPRARVVQFGDSGAGVITNGFIAKIVERWQPQLHAAAWLPGLDPDSVDWDQLDLATFYNETSAYYPDIRTAQLNSRQDSVQQLFYFLMGGIPFLWEIGARREMAKIEDSSPNFSYGFVNGSQHCFITNDLFYSDEIVEGGLGRWLEGRFEE